MDARVRGRAGSACVCVCACVCVRGVIQSGKTSPLLASQIKDRSGRESL